MPPNTVINLNEKHYLDFCWFWLTAPSRGASRDLNQGTTITILSWTDLPSLPTQKSLLIKTSYSCLCLSSIICPLNSGKIVAMDTYESWLKSSYANQDTLMEYDKNKFIFPHSPPYDPQTWCFSAWIPLVRIVNQCKFDISLWAFRQPSYFCDSVSFLKCR